MSFMLLQNKQKNVDFTLKTFEKTRDRTYFIQDCDMRNPDNP